MINSGYYKNVKCYFTNEGRTTFAKQSNGIKFSKVGAVLISDTNHTLLNAIKDNNSPALNNISLKQLNNYTQLIFNQVKYTYLSGSFSAENQDTVNALVNKCDYNYLLPVDISYTRGEKPEISYDFTLKTNSLNIDKASSDDLNFDGFALLGIPYKSIPADNNGLVEQQAPTILAFIYFEDEDQKLQILNNQPDVAAMTVELHITLGEPINLGAIEEYVDTNDNPVDDNIQTRNLVGLRQVNDGLTNATQNTNSNGTDSNVLISNMNTDLTTAYDSFAKLNIMTDAVNDLTSAVPQIMLAQTMSASEEKIWNGDRVLINYASGNDGGYFSISEITGHYRNQINAEFFGQSNIYGPVLSGVYGNNFIYSKNNKLANDVRNTNFIHSDYNTFKCGGMNNFNLINSDNNIISATRGDNKGQSAYASDVALYNSNNNVIHPQYHSFLDSKKKTVYQKGVISKAALVNSHFNYIKGRSCIPVKSTDYYEPELTFINSLSGLYNLNHNYNVTMIGSNWSWINNTSGNIIGIGEGLIQDAGIGDRIILGNYNRNTQDPNEILIVGDGKINKKWVKGQVSAIPNWNTKPKVYEQLMQSFSGEGNTARTSNYYRHNIFTVNKEGYITISDYDTNQSARYGFSGITAYSQDGQKTYEIPFENIYSQLNTNETNKQIIDEMNLYVKEVQDLSRNTPIARFDYITNKPNSTNAIFSAYINGSVTETPDSYVYRRTFEDKTILTLTYTPVAHNENPACFIWYYKKPNETSTTMASAMVEPYTSIRLMKLDEASTQTVSGFVKVQ